MNDAMKAIETYLKKWFVAGFVYNAEKNRFEYNKSEGVYGWVEHDGNTYVAYCKKPGVRLTSKKFKQVKAAINYAIPFVL